MVDKPSVTCDMFELSVDRVGGRVLTYRLQTDLPAGTRIILSCGRSYLTADGSQRVWGGHNEVLELLNPGTDMNFIEGNVHVDESDQKGVDLFKEIGSIARCRSDVKISDSFTIGMTVGARQPLRIYGKHNCNLRGRMTKIAGGVTYIEAAVSLHIPMNPAFQPTPMAEEET